MKAGNYYIGLMSGTSVDGIDAALVRFSPQLEVVATHSQEIPSGLRDAILSLALPGDNEIERLAEVDLAIARLSAKAVLALLKQTSIRAGEVTAIGSHGQTLRHLPQLGSTLQVGDPNLIAELTQIDTVADFRRRDMAAGGQGAPLVPAFHQSVFRQAEHSTAIVNIGGIANVTWLDQNGEVQGFDTGPGNMLMDAWIHQNTGQHYDKDGLWANTGKVSEHLLQALIQHPIISAKPPKSTGREDFNLPWLKQVCQGLGLELAAEDIQATLLAFTGESIIANLSALNPEHTPAPLYICGGGAQNSALMAYLKQHYTHGNVDTTQALGLDPDWVEAVAFAWLAKQFCERQPGNVPQVTGANGPRCLGALFPA